MHGIQPDLAVQSNESLRSSTKHYFSFNIPTLDSTLLLVHVMTIKLFFCLFLATFTLPSHYLQQQSGVG